MDKQSRTRTPPVEKIVYNVIKQNLTEWFEGNGPKTHINAIRDKIATAIINRVSSKQMLDNKDSGKSGSTGMPDKLQIAELIDSELIIVEGDFQRGPAKPDETLPMSQSSHSEEKWLRKSYSQTST